VAFVHWLSFRHYRLKSTNNWSGEPFKKKQQTITRPIKNFKKDFNLFLSELLECLSSSHKSMPFKFMVVQWWLQENANFKTLDAGGEWLEGFN
jgi:hypothetical protein